ncbi:21468_t:CDS:2, partial [Gigaspora margarita]
DNQLHNHVTTKLKYLLSDHSYLVHKSIACFCLTNSCKEHVVLVTPILTLRIRVLKGTLIPATEEEIKNDQAEPELVEIYKSHRTYPVAKNDLVYWVDNQENPEGEGIKEGKK